MFVTVRLALGKKRNKDVAYRFHLNLRKLGGLLPVSHRAVRASALYRLLEQLRHADVAVLRAVRSVDKLPAFPTHDMRAAREPKLDVEGTGRLGSAVH